jgi:hypothetical protein
MTAVEDAREALNDAAQAKALRVSPSPDRLILALRALIAEHEHVTAPPADDTHDPYNCPRGFWTAKCLLDCPEHRATPPTDDEREAQRGTSEDPQDSLARLIWETSRDDEGTISATGANIVARAVLTAGFHRQGPIPTVEQFKDTLSSVRRRQIAKGYTPEHDVEHGIRHILNWAIDYARRGRSEDSAGMIVAALELVDRGNPVRQGPITDAPEVVELLARELYSHRGREARDFPWQTRDAVIREYYLDSARRTIERMTAAAEAARES